MDKLKQCDESDALEWQKNVEHMFGNRRHLRKNQHLHFHGNGQGMAFKTTAQTQALL